VPFDPALARARSCASAAPPILGVDIGGTKVGLALVDHEGAVVQRHRVPTLPERGALSVLADAALAAREAFGASLDAVPAVGISIAGQIGKGGMLLGAPNLGWPRIALGPEVERIFERPATVVNDVRAATWAEWRCGAGKGCDDFVVLFVGTGIGGGAVLDGRVLDGAAGIAGEFGHTTLVAGGRACHCRNRGCLEAYAGGWAIAKRAREAVLADEAAGAALVRIAGSVECVSARTVGAARAEGDALALGLVRETGELLGAGIVSLVNGLNPSRVILGGGIMNGFPELLEIADSVVRERALLAALVDFATVRANLGNDAPAIGAAAVARHMLETRRGEGIR
jgi:glucokinase